MPDDRGRLFAYDVAKELGIKASDWRARVSRGHAPAADDTVIDGNTVRPVWRRETIAKHINRPARRGPAPNLSSEEETQAILSNPAMVAALEEARRETVTFSTEEVIEFIATGADTPLSEGGDT